MRAAEILNELGNAPAPIKVLADRYDIYHSEAPRLGIDFYMVRELSGVLIEFSVHGKYHKTNAGNAIRIFSTVKDMLVDGLDSFVHPEDESIKFGADLTEPSRVSLYSRMVPVISEILGPEWKFVKRTPAGGIHIFVWDKVNKVINEKPVQSAWISDLTYNRPNKVLTMRLSNGVSYSIPDISRATFEQWLNSPSKGYFFHNKIKDIYQVGRI